MEYKQRSLQLSSLEESKYYKCLGLKIKHTAEQALLAVVQRLERPKPLDCCCSFPPGNTEEKTLWTYKTQPSWGEVSLSSTGPNSRVVL